MNAHPLVLLGGLGVRYTAWSDVKSRAGGLRPIGPIETYELPLDAPGHRPRLTDVASALTHVLRAYETPPILLAHSMAAYVAEATARLYPETIAALLLADPSVPDPAATVLPDFLLRGIVTAAGTHPGAAIWQLTQLGLTATPLETLSRAQEMTKTRGTRRTRARLDAATWAAYGDWSREISHMRRMVASTGTGHLTCPVRLLVCESGRHSGTWTAKQRSNLAQLRATSRAGVTATVHHLTPHLLMRATPGLLVDEIAVTAALAR